MLSSEILKNPKDLRTFSYILIIQYSSFFFQYFMLNVYLNDTLNIVILLSIDL